MYSQSIFPPDHLVDHAGIGLDDLHNLIRNILIHIVRYRDTVVAVLDQLHGGVHRLQQAVAINARQDEAALLHCLGTLGGSTDAHCWEGVAHTGSRGNIKAVQGDTGHAEARMVTDTYAHGFDADRKLIAQEMDTSFFSKVGLSPAERELSEDAIQQLKMLIQAHPELLSELLTGTSEASKTLPNGT